MTALPMMMLMSDDEVAAFGRRPDASFGVLQTERGLLPLLAMDVEARVAGFVASIEVAQTFVNTTGTAIEATYIFPLPDRAAVNRFRMEVGGRVVEGIVDERGAAREDYDRAIAAGQRAAITEEERPGVFTLRVGNLMPGESATVRIGLVGPLPVDDGEVTFQFPLVVAPRYMPGSALGGDQAGLGTAADTNLVPDASRISPPVLLPGCKTPVRLGLRVALEDHHVREITSSLHAITTSKQDALVVEVQPGERLDRDFILRWRIDGDALTSSLVCADDDDGKAGTFMLTLVPPSTRSVGTRPRDVVFVLDRSGSMGGWKMVAARRAAARMIDTLTSSDRFAAIAFDNVTDAIPGANLVEATDRNRFRAVEALSKLEARGGTELMEPMRLALGMLWGGTQDRERVIVLVTDGQVGNEDQILRELAPTLRNIKVFTLGIDQAVNAAFLRRLASAGGGLCELVESEDRLDAVMAKVHRRIGTPIATELALSNWGVEIQMDTVSPAKLPDVYAGAPMTIFGRYPGRAREHGGMEVLGTTFGEPMRLRVTRHVDASPRPWLAASWARATIRDLEDRYAAGERGALEQRIVELSKRHRVLSRFTAFLAVDSEIANRGGRIRQIVQPVEEPAGWEGGAVATNAASYAPPPMGAPMPRTSPAIAQAAPIMGGPTSPPMSGRMDDAFGGMRGRGVARPGGAMPPPMAPRSMAMPSKAKKQESFEEARSHQREEAADNRAYLASLAMLARELEAQGRGRADVTAIRVLRQRLTEWVEDVRSVGGSDALASAVEGFVQRLSAALAAGTQIADEAIAVARELAELATGATPPPANKTSRVAFWK